VQEYFGQLRGGDGHRCVHTRPGYDSPVRTSSEYPAAGADPWL